MNTLLLIGGCFFLGGLSLGWLWGRVSGIEEERARQIDRLTKVPRRQI